MFIQRTNSSTDAEVQEPQEVREKFAKSVNQAAERVKWVQQFAQFLMGQEGWEKRGFKLAECDLVRLYRRALDAGPLAENELVAGSFCRQVRGCLCCQAIRSARLVHKYAPIVGTEVLRAAVTDRPLVPQHLVLTIECDEKYTLDDRLSRIQKGWERMLYRRNNARNGRCSSVLRQLAGGMGQVEVKRSSRNAAAWHVHMHCVVLVDGHYIDYRELNRQWAECVEQDTANIKLIPLKAWERYHEQELAPADFVSALDDDLREVVKYTCKPSDNSFSDAMEFWAVSGRRRLLRSFGSLYAPSKDLEKVELPEGTDWDKHVYLERAARFLMDEGRYDVEDLCVRRGCHVESQGIDSVDDRLEWSAGTV